MKKVLSFILCLGLCVGLVGCGESKEKYSPEEVEKKLTDEQCNLRVSNDEDSSTISIASEDSDVYILALFIDGEMDVTSFMNDKVNDYFYVIESDSYDESSLSKLDKEYAKEQEESFDKWLDDMGISEDELLDFIKWYYEENK